MAERRAENIGRTLPDRELRHKDASIEHVPDYELETRDEPAFRVADRFRLRPPDNWHFHSPGEVVDQAMAKVIVILVWRGKNQLVLKRFDRELAGREAGRLDISPAELERVDEQPAGIFQRHRSGSPHPRYAETQGQHVSGLAAQGERLLVGCGGCRFLGAAGGIDQGVKTRTVFL